MRQELLRLHHTTLNSTYKYKDELVRVASGSLSGLKPLQSLGSCPLLSDCRLPSDFYEGGENMMVEWEREEDR
ncbi:hypothetical protein E2C01_017331 [Portunus trituberculatus]|uniref:Uncharacterized protein n=1 Tax=Portunus trituberculatus TaxID=210409 RepID=A0A5B7DRC0_PORTR|nr:hypothetical protein [Portunus trituberculatus]